MQFESIHWLIHRKLQAIIRGSKNLVSARVISWGVVILCYFVYFRGFFYKTIIPLVLVGV